MGVGGKVFMDCFTVVLFEDVTSNTGIAEEFMDDEALKRKEIRRGRHWSRPSRGIEYMNKRN